MLSWCCNSRCIYCSGILLKLSSIPPTLVKKETQKITECRKINIQNSFQKMTFQKETSVTNLSIIEKAYSRCNAASHENPDPKQAGSTLKGLESGQSWWVALGWIRIGVNRGGSNHVPCYSWKNIPSGGFWFSFSDARLRICYHFLTLFIWRSQMGKKYTPTLESLNFSFWYSIFCAMYEYIN